MSRIFSSFSLRMFSTIACLSACLVLSAETVPESGSVSSTQAAYDGNALVLTGHVVLDHGLGKMNAEQASLQRQESGKDFPFSMIHLRKDVLLNLNTNAEIRCDSADLDFTSLKGILTAATDGKVIYSDKVKKKGEDLEFRILSQNVELGMAKKGHDGNKTDYEIETILAKDDVFIDYAGEFNLEAGHALYRRETGTKKKNAKEFQGVVTAYPKDTSSKCRLRHEGDIIDANSIDLDMPNAKVSMYQPEGFILSSLIPGLQKGELRFTCDHLTWHQDNDTLLMKGHVQVNESMLGTLTSEDELFIAQTETNGKRSLKSLKAAGRTSLEFLDKADGKIRRLYSHGSIRIEQEKMQAFVDSPVTSGKVPFDQQMCYQDGEFTVYADKANLEYSIVDDALQPVSLTMRGNVRLRSQEEESPPRAAIADRVSYSPATRTLILTANPGKRVLFWDQQQAMRISATEVHVTYDAESGKESVKGVGNVKFAFTAEESDKLQKYFPLYSISQKTEQ